MPAVNKKALMVYSGILEVSLHGLNAWRRIGSVRGVLAPSIYEGLKIRADDTKVVANYTTPQKNINGEFLEAFDTELMELILPGTRAVVAGTPVPVTAEAHGTGWTVGQPIKLTNKNGDSLVVASIVVYNDVTTLALGTDYEVYVADGTNGEKGFTYIVPKTAQTGVITADYEYTPNASTSYTEILEQTEMPNLDVRVTAKVGIIDDAFRIQINDAVWDGEYTQALLDVVEAGDGGVSAFNFIANEGGEFIFTDKVNV